MTTFYREVELDVDVEDMIEELEELGYVVLDKDDSDGPEKLKDHIYNLYRDWQSLDGGRFESKLKAFFADTINKIEL